MPDSIPPAEQARLQAAARAAITNKVVPAVLELLKRSSNQDYLPHCRDTVGLWDTPNGDAWYAEPRALVHDDRSDRRTRSTKSACAKSRASAARCCR